MWARPGQEVADVAAHRAAEAVEVHLEELPEPVAGAASALRSTSARGVCPCGIPALRVGGGGQPSPNSMRLDGRSCRSAGSSRCRTPAGEAVGWGRWGALRPRAAAAEEDLRRSPALRGWAVWCCGTRDGSACPRTSGEQTSSSGLDSNMMRFTCGPGEEGGVGEGQGGVSFPQFPPLVFAVLRDHSFAHCCSDFFSTHVCTPSQGCATGGVG